MAFVPFSAKNASVRLGNTNIFYAKSWVVTPKTNPADTTNFEGGGFGDAIGTIIEADISIDDADEDASVRPYDAPLSLTAASVVTNLLLYLNRTGNSADPHWIFPSALVTETPETAKVRDAMKISVKLYGKGSFSYPTGTVLF